MLVFGQRLDPSLTALVIGQALPDAAWSLPARAGLWLSAPVLAWLGGPLARSASEGEPRPAVNEEDHTATVCAHAVLQS